ncbi:muscarinic acetylcholine receptor M1-like [Actinia tenebrosa]|uniref:Muscarinic acetylcholine receptor M1-like n=1 Tax=Actinia tenebrosa TaxID=6105 RepID=A0A6P8IJJ5_ACTTE|nr:muscarinic acetylcholine receptor M1-like [Actinia tenebrosa]XP_031566912.1 muscarinic acetylcholine receptor M1-like [Actinia tenebrosa]XP_031566913.1 muscarinic acetylcholine receptor M1-like [Actinia tenebrosa]
MLKSNQSMSNSSRASNISNNTTNSKDSEYNRYIGVMSFTFLILILIISLVGNMLVILSFRAVQKLRTVTNFFVVSLAVADLLIAVFSMPIWAAHLLTGPDWKYSIMLMKLWTCVDIMCGVASIINLTAISIERYICITYPLSYHQTMTPHKAMAIIIGVWGFAFAMASVKFILWKYPPPLYELIIVISCFILPFFIMCISYKMIFQTARYQARQIALMVNGGVKKFFLSSEVRAAKTLAVVMGAFIISWGPFFIMNLIYGFCNHCLSAEAVMVAKWMHYSNSVFNPFVYACMNKDFRASFISILLSWKVFFRKKKKRLSFPPTTDPSELSLNNSA